MSSETIRSCNALPDYIYVLSITAPVPTVLYTETMRE